MPYIYNPDDTLDGLIEDFAYDRETAQQLPNATPEPLTVREICTAANLTQSALAARFGIPKRTVEDWCRGVAKCAPYIRRMMCECLGIADK